MSNTVSVKGTEAINFTGMSNVKSFTPSTDGVYAITLKSNVTYSNGRAPLNQAFIFNTAPLANGNSSGWFLTVANQQGVTVQGSKGNPFYVFLVDQVTSGDNTGQADVTFTQLS